MTKQDWNDIHDNYYQAYNDIFNYLDFSGKADRFTEENQVVNFCEAVKSVFPDTICWYEYPWKPKSGDSKRFDAVLYIPKKKALLVLEAKCLRHSGKYQAMTNDLIRVCEKNNTDQIKLNSKYSKSKTYVVILADYWDKGGKNNTHQEWVGQTKNGVLKNFAQAVANKNVKGPEWRAEKMGLKSNSADYYLLSMIGEI